MVADKKTGAFDEFVRRGGLLGIAEQQLKDELQKAMTERNHILRGVIEACQNNEFEEAGNILTTVLLNTQSSLLEVVALVFKLHIAQLLWKKAIEHIQSVNYKELERFPAEINVWASMQVQREEDERKWLVPKLNSQQAAERGKREITQKRHTEILKIINNINAMKSLNDSEVARKVCSTILLLKNNNDQAMRDLFPKTPSIRNIRRIISEKT